MKYHLNCAISHHSLDDISAARLLKGLGMIEFLHQIQPDTRYIDD